MIEAGILEGDTALIKKTEAADTGDIVVALIDEEEATLKRFRRRGASIALEPANTSYEVRILPPTRVRIQGKMVGCSGTSLYPGPGAYCRSGPASIPRLQILGSRRCIARLRPRGRGARSRPARPGRAPRAGPARPAGPP